LIGIHTNFPGAVRSDVAQAVQSAPRRHPVHPTREHASTEKLKDFLRQTWPTPLEMGTHPQAPYGIADSPVGLAGWMLDHDSTSLALIARVFDGQAEGLPETMCFDNITHYWLTKYRGLFGTSLSGKYGRLLRPEGRLRPGSGECSFRTSSIRCRGVGQRRPTPTLSITTSSTGRHFAAWEQPQLYSEEVRAGLRSLR
jgi:hypothetical protein